MITHELNFQYKIGISHSTRFLPQNQDNSELRQSMAFIEYSRGRIPGCRYRGQISANEWCSMTTSRAWRVDRVTQVTLQQNLLFLYFLSPLLRTQQLISLRMDPTMDIRSAMFPPANGFIIIPPGEYRWKVCILDKTEKIGCMGLWLTLCEDLRSL